MKYIPASEVERLRDGIRDLEIIVDGYGPDNLTMQSYERGARGFISSFRALLASAVELPEPGSTYSLNDIVYFKITERGHAILKKDAEEFHRQYPQVDIRVRPEIYRDDWYKNQLHWILSTFGGNSLLGQYLPVTDLTFYDPTVETRPTPDDKLREALEGLVDGLDANGDGRDGLTNAQWYKRVTAARTALRKEGA